ncbi:unnamed protein product [Clonostachys rosea f. rosea IK726]|uniref:Uncharacterized protein n=1 Tax=Clonostachys rosea f. rosea IK726 TaxID=1349383 RepID=A0ACA9TS47_BIOOC|nr:unnamed protein product [Clonostachys rosea f. rosea IK726]
MSETIDPLDVSLRDFEHPLSPQFSRHSMAPSEPATATDGEDEEYDRESSHHPNSEIGSVGGYSPPAWRRLGNGSRSSGFWRPPPVNTFAPLPFLRETSPGLDEELDDPSDDDDPVLMKAIRTQLPRGSMSPEKGRSVSPERTEDITLKVNQIVPRAKSAPLETPSENYIRFAVRAEVQHRTEPIESAISFIRKKYTALTATWTSTIFSVIVLMFSISALKSLVQPAAPRPAGDLVKVAGVARSFEPLIYYSEYAVTQIHDLQATSIAVWDLGESVRLSDMKDAASIVADLDTLSSTMKVLAEEMTRFFARVDGDIDAILNVMDWARMHLNRFHSSPNPSTLSSAYDNVHNILCQANILEDSTGALTPLGQIASWVFGPSNPQREQRMVQFLFREFLAVLEDSIQSELQHSATLFALFETVDRHFLNLARTVVRESSVQEELYTDLLSGLWARMVGPQAAQVRKFEQNRLLLGDVRRKTVHNKAVLVDHNGKLLTLQASLESLRGKLFSPLVRGVNSTILSLEDQMKGITEASDHLSGIRRQQKSKVMETLYGTMPGRRHAIGYDGGQPNERKLAPNSGWER